MPEPRTRSTTRNAALLCCALAAAALGACLPLDEAELGVCGNRIYEPEFGEDCDGTAARFGADATCGAPSSSAPCRLICDPQASTSGCPAAWGCGVDGVCRRPTAKLELSTLPGHVRAVGDLDGDGRDDLILRGPAGEATVAFMTEGRNIASVFVDPARRPIRDNPAVQPIVGRLTSDGIDDLALPLIGDDVSIRVFIGSGARQLNNPFVELVTVPFGATGEVWMRTVFNPSGLPESICAIGGCSQSLLLGKTKIDETRYAVLDDRQLIELFRLADGHKRQNATLARFDEGRSCDLLAVSYRHDADSGSPGNRVDLFSLCSGPGQLNRSEAVPLGTVPPHSSVSVEGGDEQLSLVIAGSADLDGDGHADLLVNVTDNVVGTPDDPQSYALYGSGDGHFNSRADQTGLVDRIDLDNPLILGHSWATTDEPALQLDNATWPRAVADINADGRADFMLTAGVVVLSTQDPQDECALAGEPVLAGPELGMPGAPQWGYACVLVGAQGLLDASTVTREQVARNWLTSGSLATPIDLLGNGQLGFAAIDKNKIDNVAGTDHSPPDFLDLLWIDPSSSQLTLRTLVDERFEQVAAGDLDGDFAVDLVLGGDRLEVIWGPPFELARATALSPAEFDVVQVFAEGRPSASLGAEADGRLTIFRDGQWPSLALVEPGACVEVADCHVRFAVGALGDDDDFGWAIGVVHSSDDDGLRLLRSVTGTANIGPAYDAAAAPLIPLSALGISVGADAATVVAVDLDAASDSPAIDEAIVAARTETGIELTILRPYLSSESGPLCSAPFERSTELVTEQAFVCVEIVNTLSILDRVRPYPGANDPFLEIADADNDGHVDLSWVTFNNSVMLLLGDGSGTLTDDRLIELVLPEPPEQGGDEPSSEPSEGPVWPTRIDWVRWIELNGASGRELISGDLLDSGRLWGHNVELDEGELAPSGAQQLDPSDTRHLGHLGDFDGDGIQDIALGSQVMFVQPVND